MDRMEIGEASPCKELRAAGCELERQLRIAEKHYADALLLADRIREELRALSSQSPPRPELIAGARVRFKAVIERSMRLRAVIDDLEARLDA